MNAVARHVRRCACLKNRKSRQSKHYGYEILRWDMLAARWRHVAHIKLFEQLLQNTPVEATVLIRCLDCGSELLREHPPKETTMKLELHLIETGEGWVWCLDDLQDPAKPVSIANGSPTQAKPTEQALKEHLVEVLTAVQSDQFDVYAITTGGKRKVRG